MKCKNKNLSSVSGIASTEYVLIGIAVVMSIGALTAGNRVTCISFKHSRSGGPVQQCTSAFDQISDAMSSNLSTTTTLLQLPF